MPTGRMSSPLVLFQTETFKLQIKEKDVNIGEICAHILFMPKAKSWHFIIYVTLTSDPMTWIMCMIRSLIKNIKFVPKNSNHVIWKFLHVRRSYDMAKFWRKHTQTNKHLIFLTTMSSSVQVGSTKILWPLSIILQNLNKIRCGQTKFW
jgi:hypothetical protein